MGQEIQPLKIFCLKREASQKGSLSLVLFPDESPKTWKQAYTFILNMVQ